LLFFGEENYPLAVRFPYSFHAPLGYWKFINSTSGSKSTELASFCSEETESNEENTEKDGKGQHFYAFNLILIF